MGQAKRRGTFEERAAQAKATQLEAFRQRREARIKKEEAEQARLDAMTEEERDAYYTDMKRRPLPVTMLAAAILVGSGRF